jgi:protoheme IX farnesyltransferase
MKLSTDFTLSKLIRTDKLAAYYELTKPGITFTVLISMMAGFVLGSGSRIHYLLLLQASIGTLLIAAGTAAHNQFMEWRHDGKMKRTQKRPIPTSRLSPAESFVFSTVLIFGGLFYLIFTVNLIAGLISLATTTLYLFAYTPLKRISASNVWVGAIPGSLPVVGGWAAAAGHLGGLEMWLLFGILYFWQVPHVMAIAWVCRDDYQHAGYHMLPANDINGRKTKSFMLICLAALLPVVWWLFQTGLCGWIFLIGSMLCSLAFLYYGISFSWNHSKKAARKLMFASFGYLPAIWVFVFLDQLIR